MTLARVRHLLLYPSLLSVILGASLFLRLRGLPDNMPFFGDVGRTYVAGQEILDGNLTLQGPKTSVGELHLGPFYYYLTAGALLLSGGNVVGPGVMVALGGALAVLLLSEYIRRQHTWQSALLGASILAFSPLVVEQSRIPIEPSLVPLFTMLWLWAITIWWQTKQWRWITASLFIVFLGAQLNFSFVVLGAVTFFAFVWKSTNTYMRSWLSLLTGSGLTLLIFLKILWRGTTSGEYWWAMWLRYSFPESAFVSGLLLFLFAFSAVVLIKQRENLSSKLRDLLPLWYFWGFFSLCSFFLKTVGGNHALAILFPAPAFIIATALSTQVKRKVFWSVGSFLAGIWLLSGYTTSPQESTLAQAESVVQSILSETNGEPYELIYRGHLDVYEAVDDHWQFLLSRTTNPPQNGVPIYLYSPHTASERFPSEGREVIIDKDYLLQIPE
jgi:4-amino-4-deoxy-L-arabinose transferase-like glycosyltransferase